MQEHLHIVGEAFDGLEAVQKAQELIPDLILLDIGLPNLNGIRAAVGVPAGICPQTRQTHRRTCPLPHSLLGLLPASYRGTAFQPRTEKLHGIPAAQTATNDRTEAGYQASRQRMITLW